MSSPSGATSRSTSARRQLTGLETAEAAIRDIAAAREVPDTTVELEVRVALAADGEARAVAAASSSTPRRSPARLGFDVKDTATGGASDANSTSGMGVPTLDGLGPIGGNDHSPAEYLDVDSIVPRTTLLAGLLLAIARDPRGAGVARGRPALRGVTAAPAISSGGPWEAIAGYSRAVVVGDAAGSPARRTPDPDGASRASG